MKKIYQLLALAIVVTAFSACRPLDGTYQQLGDIPQAQPSAVTASLTLAATDYSLISNSSYNYAKTSLSFKTKDDAAAAIPGILASKYPTYGEKSSIAVTYGATNPSIKLADSVNANVAVTLQVGPPSDYRWTSFTYKGTTVSANNFDDLSATGALNWLRYKNQTPPVDYTIRVLTYLYFESNVTASTGTLTTDAFIYTAANDWQKIYCVKPAQYATVNRGVNNAFVAADAANLPGIFGTFLKSDGSVMATAKTGDVIYVNYKYQTSSTVSYQRVQPMSFDGANWVTTPLPATLQFVKTNGVWVADNTVNYKLTAADYTYIAGLTTTGASAAAQSNLASFGDFNLVGTTSNWTDAQINIGLTALLVSKYGSTAVANQKFVLSYLAYNGATITATKTFQYNGTTFVFLQ